MADKSAITTELESLQLEEAREAAEQRKQKRVAKASRAEAIERVIKQDRANQEALQAMCQHKKGGRGTAQIYAGNDTNYAVVQHTLSWGKTIVICMRCMKLWEPPPPLSKKATPEERAEYREQMAEYRRALNFPTDNQPSGSQLFTFTPVEAVAS